MDLDLIYNIERTKKQKSTAKHTTMKGLIARVGYVRGQNQMKSHIIFRAIVNIALIVERLLVNVG